MFKFKELSHEKSNSEIFTTFLIIYELFHKHTILQLIQTLEEDINMHVAQLTEIYHEAGDCMRIKFKYRSNQHPW